MTTRSTIRTSVRTELQETVAGFWADSELNGWYDDANIEITAACKQEAVATATLVSGTESYSLPSDFYLIRRVEVQSSAGSATNWILVQPYNIDLRRPGDPVTSATLTSVPSGYYIFSGRIYFIPVPDAAYSATIYYFKNAAASSSDSDTPNYPEGIAPTRVDRAIFFYVCAQALRKRQDTSYQTYSSDYNASLAAIERDATDRGTAAPLQVADDWMAG